MTTPELPYRVTHGATSRVRHVHRPPCPQHQHTLLSCLQSYHSRNHRVIPYVPYVHRLGGVHAPACFSADPSRSRVRICCSRFCVRSDAVSSLREQKDITSLGTKPPESHSDTVPLVQIPTSTICGANTFMRSATRFSSSCAPLA